MCPKHVGEISIPGGVVYEDDLVYAGHAAIPEGQTTAYLGSLMVEPRRHISVLADLTDDEAQNVNDTNEKIPEVQSSLLEEVLVCVQCLPEEPRLDLSERFLSSYEAIKADQRTHKVTKSELYLEVKAQNNLQSALRFYKEDLDPYLHFIRTLIKDLREYKTLSNYTLRRLTNVDLIPNDQKALAEFIKEIAFVRAHLGEDYLDIIQGRLGSMKSEIIIAVENQQPQTN